MSFRDPWLLASLGALPLAAAAYVRAQRRGARYAVRFPALDVLAGVARPARGRHLPPLLLALAAAALCVALARPERTVAVPQREATVVIVTDTSGSMLARDVAPTRLDAARSAARGFARALPRGFRLGLVSFGSVARLDVAPTSDRALVEEALIRLSAAGGTAMGDALALALRAAQAPPRRPAAIVLLSDGTSTHGREDPRAVARRAARARVPVYTVALGTPRGTVESTGPDGSRRAEPVPPDPAGLAQIARTTRGRAFSAQNAGRLERVYESIRGHLRTRPARRELTAAFAGGALALLLAGGALGVLRAGRLP